MTTAAAVSLPDRPFRGIESFRYADRSVFFARGAQTAELAQFVSVYRGVLLYGDSGAGKSSLVNAGLIPAMEELGYRPERYRVQPRAGEELILEPITDLDASPEPSLHVKLTGGEAPTPAPVSITGLRERLSAGTERERRLLIFDQFEELVTLFQEAPRGEALKESLEIQASIVSALTNLLNDQSLRVKLVFVFREDYLAHVLKLFALSPYLRDQYVRLTPPRTDALMEIIRGPFEQYPGRYTAEISPQLAEELAAALAERAEVDEVNLSEVQIVCLRLWGADDPERLFGEKGVQGLLGDHMAEALSDLSEEAKYAAVALLSRMITASGARNVISEEDLVGRVHDEEGIKERKLSKTLQTLEKAAVIRRERRHGGAFYEIVSEFLVPWIVRQRQERLALEQLERVFEQITQEELQYHNRLFRVFRLSRLAVLATMVLTLVALITVIGLAIFADGLPLWLAVLAVTVPGALALLVQGYMFQRSVEYRDASIRLATQRQELRRLVGESGGLTGGQVSELSDRLDDYAADLSAGTEAAGPSSHR